MIVHTAKIEYTTQSKPIRIKPIADVHAGSVHCDEKAFLKWLNEDKECWFVGNGDLMDMVIASDSKRYRKSSDGTDGDDIVDEQIRKIYRWLEPHKDRIIGLGTGNHEDAITKHHGTNPTKRLCEILGCTFLGYSWLLQILFSKNGGGGRTVVIRGSHGWGGGSRTIGGDLTKYSKDIAHWEADVFLYGHVHKLQTDRIPRLVIGSRSNKLVAKEQLIGLTGSFLRTYSNTADPTYAEMKGYPPIGIGGLTLNVQVTEDGRKIWFDS